MKLAQEKLMKLMQAQTNFEVKTEEEVAVSRQELIRTGKKRNTGDYSPLPNPRKEKRLTVRAARRVNRGAYSG